MITTEDALVVLKKRVKVLKSSMKIIDKRLLRNSHKSRHVRMTESAAMDSGRMGYYIDRLQELQMIIRFLEGRETEEYLVVGGGGILW